MNNLQLENKLSSREVFQMMELKQHSDLLRKIDGINKDFNQSKIAFVKYWTEGTYKDSKGEERREFQITKRGCEFLAHKTTGTKGNLFTDRYMDKFATMEQAIRTGSYNPIGITKAEILAIIKDLPNDRLKNELSMQLMSLLPVENKQHEIGKYTREQIESILNEFLTKRTDAILKQTQYGLAVDKTKLYKHFENKGIGWTETLRLLDEYGFIYHKEGCRTIQVRYDGGPVRVVIIKE